MNTKTVICYLCGKELVGEINDDHVPPLQFYAKDLRKKHNLQLFTLCVHEECNKSYQMDEDYFFTSFAPLAMGSYSGRALWKDILIRSKRPEAEKLFYMVNGEFDLAPSGLILPDGKGIKRFDRDRAARVIWKITRGLFFKEYGRFLPEPTPRNLKFYSVGDKPDSDFFYALNDAIPKGDYPGVFDYKYKKFLELNNFHFWGILFLDKLIIQVCFHDPECVCEICETTKV